MKQKTLILGMSVFIATVMAVVLTTREPLQAQKTSFKDAKGKILADFKTEKEKIIRGPEEMKKMLSDIQAEIKKRNLKFVVELNEMMKYQIADITGASIPKDLSVKAASQYNRGMYLWKSFLNQYKLYLKQKEERENKYNDDQSDDDSYNKKDEYKDDSYGKKDDSFEKKDEYAYNDKKNEEENKEIDKIDTDIDDSPSPTLVAFSWANKNKVTPIRFQGTCGSCWAFTSTAVIEANFLIRKKTELDLSEQQLLDCAKDNTGSRAGTCGGGWYGKVFDYLMKNTITTENIIPYKNTDAYCMYAAPTQYKIYAWAYVKNNAGIPTPAEMKTALSQYGPIAACIKATPAFQAYKSGIFNEFAPCFGERDINHAITIVGWDDNKKAYHVKNSWGTMWGENGYCWVEYGCNNIGFGAAWVLAQPEMKYLGK